MPAAWGISTYNEMIAVLTLSALIVSLRSDHQHRNLGLAFHLCELRSSTRDAG